MDKDNCGLSSSKGFTLIEIIIVIVLVALLAALVISIIDPEQQMNKASDGVLIASINKLVLSTDAFVSSYNRAPNETEFFEYVDVKGEELFANACSFNLVTDYECLFKIAGIRTPHSCDLSYWTGSDVNTEECNFRYQGEIMGDTGRYRLYVKAHGIPSRVLAYDNKEGGQVFDCPFSITDFNNLTDECLTR